MILRDNIERLNEDCNQTAEQHKNFGVQLERIDEILEIQKSEVQHCKTEIEKDNEKIKEFEETVDQLWKKHIFLESKQHSLSEKLVEVNKEEQEVNKDEAKALDIEERIKAASRFLFKENEEMKKYFNKTKTELEVQIQRLKTENDLLLREHKRIYEDNRKIESRFSKLKKDCTSLVNAPIHSKTFYLHKQYDSLKIPLTSGSDRMVPKQLTENQELNVMYIPKQSSEPYKINVQARKYKTLYKPVNVSDYLDKSFSYERPKEERSSTRIEHRRQGDKLSLNRFKMIVD